MNDTYKLLSACGAAALVALVLQETTISPVFLWPLSIVAGGLGGFAIKKLFDSIWTS